MIFCFLIDETFDMPNKIFITGANGFIGHHLFDYFTNNNDNVAGCINTIQSNTLEKTYTTDLCSQEIYSILHHEQPDYLIHCAGGASVAESFLNPQKDFAKNIIITENILNAITQKSPKTKIIFLSSAAVYGNPLTLPITENTPTSPVSPYGFHKLVCELLCKKYHELYHIPITILRIFSVYGPGLKKQLLWDIYQKSKTNDIISLFGTGDETRDFIYIDDLVRIIHTILLKTSFKGEIFNVASGEETKVCDIAHLMISAFENKKELCFQGNQKPGDPTKWAVDISLLKKIVSHSLTPLSIGVKNYMHWLHDEEKSTCHYA